LEQEPSDVIVRVDATAVCGALKVAATREEDEEE
jgi:hypothetical protein